MDRQKFIDKYSRFYFLEGEKENNSNEALYDELKIKAINRTAVRVENKICDLLEKGIYNKLAFAWKLGTLGIEHLEEHCEPLLKGRYCDYSEPDRNNITIEKYIKISTDIVNQKSNINWKDWDTIEYIYIDLAKNSMRGFGAVYIITSMYFLSKGEIPIFDRFAYKAIKALLMKKNPNEIFAGEAPAKLSKKTYKIDGKEYEHYDSINLLKEYVYMIQKVFDIDFKREGEFVSRELDQALWVYGHSNVGYNTSQYESVINCYSVQRNVREENAVF